MFRLDGKVALVTGSTRGIGWAIAGALAGAGATVAVNGRDPDATMAKAGELSLDGGRAFGVSFDVADLAAARAGLGAVVDRHGAIDILVNNAGIQHRAPALDFAHDDWERVLATNLTAPFALAQVAAAHMQAAGSGRIINVGSVLATVARPTVPAYIASKTGLAGLTRALAVEFGGHGITVNAIAPGYIATDLNKPLLADPAFNEMVIGRTPVGRWGTPEQVAAAAVFLASDEASYVNGHVLAVDGGMSIAL